MTQGADKLLKLKKEIEEAEKKLVSTKIEKDFLLKDIEKKIGLKTLPEIIEYKNNLEKEITTEEKRLAKKTEELEKEIDDKINR